MHDCSALLRHLPRFLPDDRQPGSYQLTGRTGICKTGWLRAVRPNPRLRFCSHDGSSAVHGSSERELPTLPVEKNRAPGTTPGEQEDPRSLPPWHLPLFGPQTRCFLAMAGRKENVQDWLAERSQFELVGPFCQEVFSKTRWEAFAWEFRWRFLVA